MSDQRSAIAEFRDLEQRRLASGLTSTELARYEWLRRVVGNQPPPPGSGFDMASATSELHESLLPAGLGARAAAPPPPPTVSESGWDASWLAEEEPPIPPPAPPTVKPQAWNPAAPGYDPDAPYDEAAWIAAGYDPNIVYDWSAVGAAAEEAHEALQPGQVVTAPAIPLPPLSPVASSPAPLAALDLLGEEDLPTLDVLAPEEPLATGAALPERDALSALEAFPLTDALFAPASPPSPAAAPSAAVPAFAEPAPDDEGWPGLEPEPALATAPPVTPAALAAPIVPDLPAGDGLDLHELAAEATEAAGPSSEPPALAGGFDGLLSDDELEILASGGGIIEAAPSPALAGPVPVPVPVPEPELAPLVAAVPPAAAAVTGADDALDGSEAISLDLLEAEASPETDPLPALALEPVQAVLPSLLLDPPAPPSLAPPEVRDEPLHPPLPEPIRANVFVPPATVFSPPMRTPAVEALHPPLPEAVRANVFVPPTPVFSPPAWAVPPAGPPAPVASPSSLATTGILPPASAPAPEPEPVVEMSPPPASSPGPVLDDEAEAAVEAALTFEPAATGETGALAEVAPTEVMPFVGAAVEEAPIEETPIKAAPVEAALVEASPVQAAPFAPEVELAPEPEVLLDPDEIVSLDPEPVPEAAPAAAIEVTPWVSAVAPTMAPVAAAPAPALPAEPAPAPIIPPPAALHPEPPATPALTPAPPAPPPPGPASFGAYDDLAPSAPRFAFGAPPVEPVAGSWDAGGEPALDPAIQPYEPAPPGTPLGEYDEQPLGGAGGSPIESMLPFDPAAAAAIPTGSVPEGYEAPPPEEPSLALDIEVVGPPVDPAAAALAAVPPVGELSEVSADWQPERALDHGFDLVADGSFGLPSLSLGEAPAWPAPAPQGAPIALAPPGPVASPRAFAPPAPPPAPAGLPPSETLLPTEEVEEVLDGIGEETLEALPPLRLHPTPPPAPPQAPANVFVPPAAGLFRPPPAPSVAAPPPAAIFVPPAAALFSRTATTPALTPRPGTLRPVGLTPPPASPRTPTLTPPPGRGAPPPASPPVELDLDLEVEAPRPGGTRPPAVTPAPFVSAVASAPVVNVAPAAAVPAPPRSAAPVAPVAPRLKPTVPAGPPPVLAPPAPPVVAPPPPAPAPRPATVELEALPPLLPSTRFEGSHRVLIHTVDGDVRRGVLESPTLDGDRLTLLPQGPGAPQVIETAGVKAVFFLLASGERPPAPEGRKVRVTFRDGRQVLGVSPDYQEGQVGFLLIPTEARTTTARIWVYQASVRQVVIG